MLKFYLYFELFSNVSETQTKKYVDFQIYVKKSTKIFHNFLNLFESQNPAKTIAVFKISRKPRSPGGFLQISCLLR
jgi:hypothetical protein